MVILGLILGFLVITGGIVTIFQIAIAPEAYETEEAFCLGAQPPGSDARPTAVDHVRSVGAPAARMVQRAKRSAHHTPSPTYEPSAAPQSPLAR